ncbi:hypothetical protein DFQ27_003847 [Actinomortierella ambigua]|uniref:TPR-like protein n=1 Tax=Actinomortierella ambigua TaxID=1343610 RepID=A0A9P6UCI4_9FUNG|nr:hypothetical protein DFQ26_001289 [Actinomortierella ambigua]KAG0269338.1 hypothetical protein DFQ27_003847 [Actinomortierella ambigua]
MPTIAEKIASALTHKDQGNAAFKQGSIQQALRSYHLSVLGLSGLETEMTGMPMMAAASQQGQNAPVTDEQKKQIKTQLAIVYANMAACHLKNQNWKRAIETATTALKHDETNTKAKFRRAQAKIQEGNLTSALQDLEALDQKDAAVKAELQKIKQKEKEAEQKQRKQMGGFLSRGRVGSDNEDEATTTSAAATSTTKAPGSPSSGAGSSSGKPGSTKSKPTLASKLGSSSTRRKTTPSYKDDEYIPSSTWSGTAPKIQELQDGEE